MGETGAKTLAWARWPLVSCSMMMRRRTVMIFYDNGDDNDDDLYIIGAVCMSVTFLLISFSPFSRHFWV